jgi:hypothetical protein
MALNTAHIIHIQIRNSDVLQPLPDSTSCMVHSVQGGYDLGQERRFKNP